MAEQVTKIKLTAEGKRRYEAELNELKTVKRKEIAENLQSARAQGDLSENSEYDEAKNDQAKLEARILKRYSEMLRSSMKARSITKRCTSGQRSRYMTVNLTRMLNIRS